MVAFACYRGFVFGDRTQEKEGLRSMDDGEFKKQLRVNLDVATNKARDELKRMVEEAAQHREKELETYQKEYAKELLTHDISYLFAKLKLDLALQLERMQSDILEQIKRIYGG